MADESEEGAGETFRPMRSFEASPDRQQQGNHSAILKLNDANGGADDDTSCPCTLVLPTNDSCYCSLCSAAIPTVDRLMQDRTRLAKQVDDMNRQLTEELVRQERSIRDNQRLTLRVRELEEQLGWRNDELATLRKDLQSMSTKMIREIEKRVEVCAERDRINQELEELTSSLFEQANVMVADETKRRHQLQSELQQTRSKLETERVATLVLRKRLLHTRHKLRMHSVDGADCMTNPANNDNAHGNTSGKSSCRQRHLTAAAEQLKFMSDNNTPNSVEGETVPAAGETPANVIEADTPDESISMRAEGVASSRQTTAAIAAHSPLLDALTMDNLVMIDVDFMPDRRVFDEFTAMVDRISSNGLSLQKSITSIPFLKSCYEEFVEPCVRLPRLAHKKIIEGLMGDDKQVAAQLLRYSKEQKSTAERKDETTAETDASKLHQMQAATVLTAAAANGSDRQTTPPPPPQLAEGGISMNAISEQQEASQIVGQIATTASCSSSSSSSSPGKPQFWMSAFGSAGSINPPSGPSTCGGCGKSPIECPYQIIFSIPTGSSFTAPFSTKSSESRTQTVTVWLDRFCGDRWLAVLEFFDLLRKLQSIRQDKPDNNRRGTFAASQVGAAVDEDINTLGKICDISSQSDDKDLFLRFIDSLKSLFYARIGLLTYVRSLLSEISTATATSPDSA